MSLFPKFCQVQPYAIRYGCNERPNDRSFTDGREWKEAEREWLYRFESFKVNDRFKELPEQYKYVATKETFTIKSYNRMRICYPEGDWFMPGCTSDIFFHPDTDIILPPSALSCLEHHHWPTVSPVEKFQNTFKYKDPLKKAQYMREQRDQNPFYHTKFWITAQGDYMDESLMILDKMKHINAFHAYLTRHHESYPVLMAPPLIKGPVVFIEHPFIKFAIKSSNWRNSVIQQIQTKSYRHHPINLIDVEDTSFSVVRPMAQSSIGSSKRWTSTIKCMITPGSRSYFSLLKYGRWDNMELPPVDINGSPVRFKARSCNIVAPKRALVMFDLPSSIVTRPGIGAQTIASGFREQVKRLLCLDICHQLIDSNYDISAINFLNVFNVYFNPDHIVAHDMRSNTSCSSNTNNPRRSPFTTDNPYDYSNEMIQDMRRIIEELAYLNSDYIDTDVLVVREWCINIIHRFSYNRMFRAEWPPCYLTHKLEAILSILAPMTWITRICTSYNHQKRYHDHKVRVTPLYTTNINVSIITGDVNSGIPAARLQVGHSRVGACHYSVPYENEYLGTLHCCPKCQMIAPRHTAPGCVEAIEYGHDAEKAIDIKSKKQKWNHDRVIKAKKAIYRGRCHWCSGWGHTSKDCDVTSCAGCTNCGGGHAFCVELFRCDKITSMSKMLKSGNQMVYNDDIQNVGSMSITDVMYYYSDGTADELKETSINLNVNLNVKDITQASLPSAPSNDTSDPSNETLAAASAICGAPAGAIDLLPSQPKPHVMNDDTPCIKRGRRKNMRRKPRPPRGNINSKNTNSRSRSRNNKSEADDDNDEDDDDMGDT